MTRILALDIGDKRIGVALSDQGGIIASPLTILERTDDQRVIGDLIGYIREYETGLIVAGLPMTKDGLVGHQAEKVRSFIDELKQQTDTDIIYRDESLTTQKARQSMQVTRKKKKRATEKDDAIAAAFLLQGYLDESRNTFADLDEDENTFENDR